MSINFLLDKHVEVILMYGPMKETLQVKKKTKGFSKKREIMLKHVDSFRNN